MQVPISRSLLAASPYTVSTSAWISPPYADLTYPEVQDLIQAAYSNTTNAAGLALQQLTSLSKQGVAGNGLCENGEMPSSVGNFTGELLQFVYNHLWPQRSGAGLTLLIERSLAQCSRRTCFGCCTCSHGHSILLLDICWRCISLLPDCLSLGKCH